MLEIVEIEGHSLASELESAESLMASFAETTLAAVRAGHAEHAGIFATAAFRAAGAVDIYRDLIADGVTGYYTVREL